jgi:(p)ppGpp synthase/HD superfamily hydrolase
MESILEKAKLFSFEKHRGHIDDSGLPYFESHIVQVVEILEKVTQDPDIISAAWLHDTIEDTDTSYEELKEIFGYKIADLVMEVTHEGQKDCRGFYFPRLKSKEAILIKFADRLSNLSRMEKWDIHRQNHYLRKSKFWRSE